jgi:hypothetical protein
MSPSEYEFSKLELTTDLKLTVRGFLEVALTCCCYPDCESLLRVSP